MIRKTEAPAPTAVAPDPLAALHDFEETRRKATDFAHLPASDRVLGADPYALRLLPGAGPPRFVALLRGESALVLLDASLKERARIAAPPSPTGLAIAADGEVFISGEQSPRIARLRVVADQLRVGEPILLPGVLALRDLSLGPERVLYAALAHDGHLLSIPLDHPEQRTALFAGKGAFRVARVGAFVIVDSLLEHRLSVFPVDAAGMPIPAGVIQIQHDGPIWGFDALEAGGTLWIAAAGVEDHPLDRRGGSFGYIDSFVFLYRLSSGARAAERVGEINVSAEGVVTPKALLLRESKDALTAWTAGYGSDRLLEIAWPKALSHPPTLQTRRALPGITALIRAGEGALIGADPLLDGFVSLSLTGPPEADPLFIPTANAAPPTPIARLGEALFFTTLMAPWNRSQGPLSRFTCETCHFEGQVDGRTHHTGRGEVHATTKPLLGLFNNRPHFSRALDPDLTTVADAEFRVAGALSDHDPWFTATRAEAAWLHHLALPESALTPIELRRALMTFLMAFTHRPNPAAIGREAFSAQEKRGAELFQQHCEGCHSARLVSDEPSSKVPFEGWERLIFSREGPIVWASSEYRKTGVEPYVHEQGARVPSLRRLFAKHPYFTNGSAKDLESVLSRARFGQTSRGAPSFTHDGEKAGDALTDDEQRALRAFLDLL